MRKQSKTRNSFTASHGQAGVQPSPGKQGSIMCNSYLGRQVPSLQMSPTSFFFPQLSMLSMMSYGLEYPFGQLGSAVPAVSPPSSLCTPSLLAGGVRSRNGLDSVSALLSNNENIPELSTLFPAQIQNVAPYWLLCRKLTLSQPKPAQVPLAVASYAGTLVYAIA